MTFQTFEHFEEWCIDNEKVTVEPSKPQENALILRDLQETTAIYAVEVLVSAFDSGFIFGGFFAEEKNGCLVIYDD